ncbi:hypothetical protein B5K08_05005 [Rhizobium leguminosarum bv. trifolii]|uniref:Uncharacterized protein n=1 Tax=Rhizobium leguminosarum bv. trifolii TaxID=386 RepID=A0A3E1BXH3_RHILT|nr:hypothetical protein B5K08_05005 [Rhizobium leguminosarum bv. trifolii]RFB99866.1 hypothetical protein B5K10_04995 [Rhizobium leguminosarum bv. trifolii]
MLRQAFGGSKMDEAMPRFPFAPAGRRCRQADEGASDDRSEALSGKRRAMNGVPCGPLIRPFGPPSPRWGEEGASSDLRIP